MKLRDFFQPDFDSMLLWVLNSSELDKWRERWDAAEAAQYRLELGWEGFATTPTSADPFQTFTHHLLSAEYEYQSVSDPAEWLRDDPIFVGKQPIDRPSNRKFAQQAGAALVPFLDWIERNEDHPAAFFEKLAKYLRKRGKQAPNPQSLHIKLLNAFMDFLNSKRRLPRKDELEKAMGRSASDSATSNRRVFNRMLKEVGLDGLPERPAERRSVGPLVVSRKRRTRQPETHD